MQLLGIDKLFCGFLLRSMHLWTHFQSDELLMFAKQGCLFCRADKTLQTLVYKLVPGLLDGELECWINIVIHLLPSWIKALIRQLGSSCRYSSWYSHCTDMGTSLRFRMWLYLCFRHLDSLGFAFYYTLWFMQLKLLFCSHVFISVFVKIDLLLWLLLLDLLKWIMSHCSKLICLGVHARTEKGKDLHMWASI